METTTKPTKRVSLPVRSWVSDAGEIYHAVEYRGDYLTTAHGRRESTVKRDLQRQVLDVLKADQVRDRNFQRRLIVCKDGTVLIIEYKHGWEYRIAHEGYASASACMMGQDSTFKEVLEAAVKHANSAYGGIAWESSL